MTSRSNNSSPVKQSDIWKVLHGAPPTPPPPRRDPDRNPVPAPTAGQQQKAFAGLQAGNGSLDTAGGRPAQLSQHQHTYSAGSLDTLNPTFAPSSGNFRPAGQPALRNSWDDLAFRQNMNGIPAAEQQQFGGARQAWGTGGPVASSGKYLPSLDFGGSQVWD